MTRIKQAYPLYPMHQSSQDPSGLQRFSIRVTSYLCPSSKCPQKIKYSVMMGKGGMKQEGLKEVCDRKER